MRCFGVLLGVLGLLTLIACTSTSLSGSSYSRSDARKGYQVESGEVVSVRPVYIHGEATALGRAGGAAVGYAVGRDLIPKYYTPRAVGGVVGGVVGGEAEKAVTGETGVELTMALENGGTIVIVQDDDVDFVPGDRVRVLHGNGQTRAQH
jgi:outer membrane lipoprotein SlyB